MKNKLTLFICAFFTSPLNGMDHGNIGPIDYPTVPKINAQIKGRIVMHLRERTDNQPLITVRGTDPQNMIKMSYLAGDSLSITTELKMSSDTTEYYIYYPVGVIIELLQERSTIDIDSVKNLQAILKKGARLQANYIENADIQIEDVGTFEALRGRGESLKLTIAGGNASLRDAKYATAELVRNPVMSTQDTEERKSCITITNADITSLKATLRTACLTNFNLSLPAIGVWGQVRKAKLQIFPNEATENIFVESVTEELVSKIIPTQGKGRDSSIIVEKSPAT